MSRSSPPPSRSNGSARGEGAVLQILVAQDLPSANPGAARRRSSSNVSLQALAGNEGASSTPRQHRWLRLNAGKVDALECILALRPSTLDIKSTMIAQIQGKHE
jgi:hypothetical protein